MLNTKTCFVLIFPQRINSFDQDILHNVDINPSGDLIYNKLYFLNLVSLIMLINNLIA